MKKIFYYLNILVAFCLASCNETLDVEVDGSENIAISDLAFSKYGYRTVELVTITDTYAYPMEVTYTAESLDIALEIDEEALAEYNDLYDTGYELLPAEYYELPATFNWTTETTQFSVIFHTQAIIESIGVEEASNYVLPIQMRADAGDLTLGKQLTQALLHVQVNEPTIYVGQNILSIAMDDTTRLTNLVFSARYNVESLDSDAVQVSVTQADVDTYNAQNGTSYPMLPAANFAYQGIAPGAEDGELTFDFDVYGEGLDWVTYLLPARIASDFYDIDGSEVFYYLITVNRTAPEYLAAYTVSAVQPTTNDYSFVQRFIDLSEPAAVFGISQEELEGSVQFYGVNADETLYRDGYTANNGYWYANTGNVTNWGTEGCALYVEFNQEESSFHIGQFPDAASAWDTYTVSMAMVYEGSYIKYTFVLDVVPAFLQTYDLVVDEAVNNEYVSTGVAYDFAAAAAAFGVTEGELSAGMSFYSISANGGLATSYTANTGYWYDNTGNVTNWGTEGCSLFVEYGGDGVFNVGQFPNATAAGNSYTVTILLVYNEQLIRYNITLNIV